jgi:hypothetical protein
MLRLRMIPRPKLGTPAYVHMLFTEQALLAPPDTNA